MSRLKCPDCGERTCRYDVTSFECYNCDSWFPPEAIEEHALDASDEGIPMECPYCERPTLKFFVTGESCSSCDYYQPLGRGLLNEFSTDKYDDRGDEENAAEPKDYPEVVIGSNFCVVYNGEDDFQ